MSGGASRQHAVPAEGIAPPALAALVEAGGSRSADLALAVTDDGTVWAGTAQGVSRAGPERQWSTYTALDGLDSLVDNHVRVIKIGDDGSVWFGTSRGISRLEPNGFSIGAAMA